MKRRRQRLQVSTFPFLAVLLCTMGSLILLLLVMDKRAKAVARAKGKQAAAQAQADQDKTAEDLRAEWEHRRQALRASLDEEFTQAQTQTEAIQGQAQRTAVEVLALEERIRELRERLGTERSRLALEEKELDQRRTAAAGRTHQAETLRDGINRLAESLVQLERTLADLKAARKREQQTYSVVPYKGKSGDARRPIYVECGANELVFHPNPVVLETLRSAPADIRAEVERRIARQKSDTSGTKGKAYLFMLIRPSGVETYYRAIKALDGMDVDFGYEFIEPDWVLDFPDDPSAPITQPWMAGSKTVTPPASDTKPAESRGPLRGMPANPGAATASGNTGTPGGSRQQGGSPSRTGFPERTGPREGTVTSEWPGGVPGFGTGVPRQPGPTPAGSHSAQGSSEATLPGLPGAVRNPGTPSVQRPEAPGAASGSTNLPSAGVVADPVTGSRGPGVRGFAGEQGNGPPWPATSGSSGTAALNAGPVPRPGTADTATNQGTSPGSGVAGTNSTAAPVEPTAMGATGRGPAIATGTARPGGVTATGNPASPGAGQVSRSTAPTPTQSRQPVEGAGSSPGEGSESEATTQESGRGGQAEATEGANGGESDPLASAASRLSQPLPQEKPTRPAAVRPGRIAGNREWTVIVECGAEAFILSPGKQRIAASASPVPRGTASPLFQAVQKMIERRQATVRPGETPYQIRIRFQVRPDGMQAYRHAYTALDALRVPMTSEFLEIDP